MSHPGEHANAHANPALSGKSPLGHNNQSGLTHIMKCGCSQPGNCMHSLAQRRCPKRGASWCMSIYTELTAAACCRTRRTHHTHMTQQCTATNFNTACTWTTTLEKTSLLRLYNPALLCPLRISKREAPTPACWKHTLQPQQPVTTTARPLQPQVLLCPTAARHCSF